MLRVEKIFTGPEIQEELDAYNALIPNGGNWKATFMIEYPDVAERQVALEKLAGVEHKIWAKIADEEKLYAIANEDMERSNDNKTAAVHFLRFELGSKNIELLKAGAELQFGVDHAELPYQVKISGDALNVLVADLD